LWPWAREKETEVYEMKGKDARWKKSKIAESAAAELAVVIETPRGSRNKLKHDPATQMFKLSKVMPEGMVFPYDFGYVPSTKAEDDDPLDVLVLTDEPLFPGCQVDCRLIGTIEAEQEQEGEKYRNDRLIAVAKASLLYSELTNIDELNPIVLNQIEEFFVNYQRVRGVKFKVLGRHGWERAAQTLRRAAAHKHAA
jgi:inorganic pyrophosphatase